MVEIDSQFAIQNNIEIISIYNDNDHSWNDFRRDLLLADEIAWDTETTGLFPLLTDYMVSASFFFPKTNNAYFIPFRHQPVAYKGAEPTDDPDNSSIAILDEILRETEALERLTWYGFNTKFDMHVFAREGWQINKAVDVRHAAHLYTENEKLFSGGYSLKGLSAYYLGDDSINGEKDLKERAKKLGLDPKAEMWKMPAEDVSFYAAMDAIITWKLYEFYYPFIVERNQVRAWNERNEALIPYYWMERNGIRFDQAKAEELKEGTVHLVEEMKAELQALLGFGINHNSPSQVLQAFNTLGIKLENTGKVTLEHLSNRKDKIGELASLILDLRTASKAVSSYYKKLIPLQDVDGYVHTTLNTAGTSSGRLSSSDPNAQQNPKASKRNFVKQIFVPTPGYVLAQFDFKNLEAMLVAHYVNEPVWKEMFKTGGDLHNYTARHMTEALHKAVSRYEGKQYNFSFIYGMGAGTASTRFGMSRKNTEDILGAWHGLFPNVKRGYKSARALARQWREGKQYIQLMNGRRRNFHDFYYNWTENGIIQNGAPVRVMAPGPFNFMKGWIDSYDEDLAIYTVTVQIDDYNKSQEEFKPDEIELQVPYYKAFNFLIQGTAAIINERSVIKVFNAFQQDLAMPLVRLIFPVHDSIFMEIREDVFNEVVPQIIALMEDHPGFDPPLKVDVEASSKSWWQMFGFEYEIELADGTKKAHKVPATIENLYEYEQEPELSRIKYLGA